jgi:hypothetical protein
LEQPERFVSVLKEMRELLLKYDDLGHADVVSRLIDLANLGSPEFLDRLLWGGVWGSAGSLADVQFTGNVEGPETAVYEDDVEYRRLLVRLADEMRSQGVRDEGVEWYANGLRRALEQYDRKY